MIGKDVDIQTPDGAMDAYVAHPDGGGPFPLVVLFMDVWGLREELFAIARNVAAKGYYCVVPNLFYREGKVRYEKRNAQGKMASFTALPPDKQAEMMGRSGKVDRERSRTDIAAILEFCRGEPVTGGAAGSAGFCLGGRVAFYAGQEFPRFRANASLHGTWLIKDVPDSPHLFIGRMRGEMYCGFGALDRFGTPETVAALGDAFAANPNVTYRRHVHAGAEHGYSLPDRDIHVVEATALDWREIFAMFERELRPSNTARSGA
jgi:carboxymethylenebutenolidase